MPNLVKLYTHNRAIMVNTAELYDRMTTGSTRLMTIYTTRGNRLIDTVAHQRKPNGMGYVHPANLFASKGLALAMADRILEELFSK